MEDDSSFTELMAATQDAYDSLQRAQTLSELMTHLELFKESVEQFGLSSSLLAFADADGALSTSIPAIPSLEAYLADVDLFDSSVAVESIMERIKEISKRFFTDFTDHVLKYRKWYVIALAVCFSACSFLSFSFVISASRAIATFWGYVYRNRFARFIGRILKSRKVVMGLYIPAGAVMYALHCAKSTPDAIREVLMMRLPTTPAESNVYLSKVQDIFSRDAGLDVEEMGASRLHYDEQSRATRDGYTEAQINEIVSDLAHAVEGLKKCGFIPDRLQRLAESKEASTTQGRAALMFITKLIGRVMHVTVNDVVMSAKNMKSLQGELRDVADVEDI